MRRTALLALSLAATALAAASARAREIHLDCAGAGRTAKVDIDADRRFLQIMWGEGVAEEYQEGESYLSGPDSAGETQKVVYSMRVDGDAVAFGQDRLCLADGAKHKCVEQHIRNRLNALSGEMQYADGDEVLLMKCQPANRKGF